MWTVRISHPDVKRITTSRIKREKEPTGYRIYRSCSPGQASAASRGGIKDQPERMRSPPHTVTFTYQPPHSTLKNK